MPPSLTENGGSSTTAESIISAISERVSIEAIFLSAAVSAEASLSASAGRQLQQFASDLRSLPFAVPYTMRPIRRCMSVICLKISIVSDLTTLFLYSSSTAAFLRFMAIAESSGFSIQLLSILPPIGVFVLSSTQRRDPLFSPVLWDSVSSRLLAVTQSSSIYFFTYETSGELMWLRSNF